MSKSVILFDISKNLPRIIDISFKILARSSKKKGKVKFPQMKIINAASVNYSFSSISSKPSDNLYKLFGDFI